jgi:hypothetical protein
MIWYQGCDDAIIAVVEFPANMFRDKTQNDCNPSYRDGRARQSQNPDLQVIFDGDDHVR